MKLETLMLALLLSCSLALGQTPQHHTATNWPVNAQWVNGVAPGYRPQDGGGLTLNVGPGESLCTAITSYSGGTLSLTANATNYVYVDGTTCLPTVAASLPATAKPIAKVVTSWVGIYSIDDLRTVFSVQSSGGIPNPLNTVAIQDKGGQVFNVTAYGAKGDGKNYFDGVLAAGGFGSAAQFDHTGSSSTATAPSVTTTADNSLAMQVWLVPQTWGTAPTVGTNRLTETLGGGMFNFTVHDENITPPGVVAAASGTTSAAVKWNAATIFAGPTTGNTISFVSVSDHQQSTGATITVTAPAGLSTGQVVIGCVGYSHSSSNVISAAPAGMTLLFSSTDAAGFGALNCYYQTVGTPPASYAWTQSPQTTFGMSAFVAAYTNINTGGLTFSSASAPFTGGSVGDPICVAGVGASSGQICGTIASFISSSSVTLSSEFNSATPGSSLWFNFGTNDGSAFASALTAAQATPGGVLYAPCGNYVLTSALNIAPNLPIRITGCAPGAANTESNYLNSYPLYNLNVGTVLQFDTTALTGGAVSFKAGSFTTNFASGYALENLAVYGGAGKARDGGGNDGVDIIAFPWVTLKNVFVANFAGQGVYIDYLGNAAGQGWITNVALDHLFSFWNGGMGVKVGSTFTGHRLENISVDEAEIENNGGPGLGLVGANIQGFSLTNSIVQWDNVAAANPEIQISSTSVSGCRIQSNYIEGPIAGTGSQSNAPFTANASGCVIGPNYLNGFSGNNDGNYIASKSIRSGNSGNTDLAGQITLAAGSGSFTFTGTYSSAPICTASDTTAANAVKVSTTTTALTLTGTTTDVINYVCFGRN